MRVPDRFSQLSEPMQRALVRALNDGIPVAAPRSMGVQRSTVNALAAAGLLVARKTKKGRELWRPTDRGRGLVVRDEPRVLTASGAANRGEWPDELPEAREPDPSEIGYSSDPSNAMYPDAGEAVDEHAQAASTRAAHQRDHERREQLRAERERMPVLERLRLAQADAERRGVMIDKPMYAIKQRVRAIEELVYGPADRIATS